MSDAAFMAQALALAALGEGTTRPNPLVGCVVVNGGRVVGRGYHRAAGQPHAEVAALAEAGGLGQGSTLYVNLEPCAHRGRTGPCTDAIIGAQVEHVVAAIGDPNPLVDGRGLAALRAAGIRVTTGVLAADARRLNAPFLSTHERRRPWVTLKAAQSLDGRIAAAGGRSRWITGDAARRYAHRLRFRHDAIVAGAETVRRDDPSLTVRLPGVTAPRQRAVLAPRLGLDPRARVFAREGSSSPLTRIYVDEDCPAREIDRFLHVAEIVRVGGGIAGLDLRAVLSDLSATGAQSVLVEGGGRTAGAFLAAGLVDEAALFVASRWIGAGTATPVIDLPAVDDPASAWRFVDAVIVPLGRDAVVFGRPESP